MGLRIAAVGVLVMLDAVSAGRGQIIGQMNEVDDDNNIVGPVPFNGQTFNKKSTALLESLKAVLTWLLIIVVLSVVVFGAYRLHKWYT